MNNKVIKTGIADLDDIIADTVLVKADDMIIDKSIFDGIIIPLITEGVELPPDERFNHLVNIWRNYGDTGDNVGSSLFKGFAIVDTDGITVATTPPLLKHRAIENANKLLDSYLLLAQSNTRSADNLLSNNSQSFGRSVESTEWRNFFKKYNGSTIDIIPVDWDDQGLVES